MLAEHEPALGLAVAQQLAALGGQVVVLEQRVVGGDRLGLQPAALALADPHGHQTAPGSSFPSASATWRHQRCSPFHGGVRSPRA